MGEKMETLFCRRRRPRVADFTQGRGPPSNPETLLRKNELQLKIAQTTCTIKANLHKQIMGKLHANHRA